MSSFLTEKEKLLLINGYIHNTENEEGIQIIQDIIHVCCIFYGYNCDEWNNKMLDKNIFSIDKLENILTRHKLWRMNISCDSMVLGQYPISNKTIKKQWKLQILPYKSTSNYFFIGISTIDKNKFYALYAADGTLTSHATTHKCKYYQYCDQLNVGDIITMVYENKTLKYIINDKDFGIAFYNIDFEKNQIYYLRVNMVMPSSLRLFS